VKYLLWRSKVKAYIEDVFFDVVDWERLAIWRDYYIDNKSPELAATEAHDIYLKSL